MTRVWDLQAGKAQNLCFTPRKANHAAKGMYQGGSRTTMNHPKLGSFLVVCVPLHSCCDIIEPNNDREIEQESMAQELWHFSISTWCRNTCEEWESVACPMAGSFFAFWFCVYGRGYSALRWGWLAKIRSAKICPKDGRRQSCHMPRRLTGLLRV